MSASEKNEKSRTGCPPIVLKNDPLLGLYARVEAQAANRVRGRLAKRDIRFSADSKQAAHLAEPGKTILVFGGQHPLSVRDAMAARDMAVEVDPAVVLSETTYRPPLDQLLSLGDPRKQGKGVKYAERGIGREHVPELIRMATDEALHTGLTDSEICWAPVHAWSALGELRAEEAIGPLLGLLRRVDEDEDDWVEDDVPAMLAEIGPSALEPAAAYLADSTHGDYARNGAARAIALMGQSFPVTYDDCVARLTAQLERYATQSPMLNALLISSLLDMEAKEAAPVMEKAFAAGRVDEDVGGDWEDVQIELGLKPVREHERKPTKLMELGAKLRALWTAKTAKPEEPAPSPAERA